MPETLTATATDRDEVANSLEDLARTVEENVRDQRLLARRIRRLREGRTAGRSWSDLLGHEPRPGVLQLTSGILARLTEASGHLRRSLAAALRAEGVTIPAIAALFGVSHQRVSALLRRNDDQG